MDLSNLKPAEGAVKNRKRIGRGEGSGKGGTSTRGHKGAQSRSGYKTKRYFEGGQMPLQRRVPKRGFKNRFRVAYQGINLDTLQAYIDKYNMSKVDMETLVSNKIVSKNDLVKILGRGELTSKVEITVHAVSKTAKENIESSGSTINLI